MKTIFKKSNLPFLKPTLHNGRGRDFWSLARTMQDENGLQHQLPAELSLLSRAVADDDVWAMCELARNYYQHCGDLFLPEALRLWRRAALRGDGGAAHDLQTTPIYQRILAYRNTGDYRDVEVKCALLTEWHLRRFGLNPWEKANRKTQKDRVSALVRDVCPILGLPDVKCFIIPRLSLNGAMVDGLAHWEGRIDVREETLDDIERMIEVIFHELGHIVTFEMMRGGERGKRLQALYGISDARAASWREGKMGYEVTTSEEDPDTLSYGVYTMWATFFV